MTTETEEEAEDESESAAVGGRGGGAAAVAAGGAAKATGRGGTVIDVRGGGPRPVPDQCRRVTLATLGPRGAACLAVASAGQCRRELCSRHWVRGGRSVMVCLCVMVNDNMG